MVGRLAGGRRRRSRSRSRSARGRSNVGFLVAARLSPSCVVTFVATHPRRTPAGNALVGDLRTLFGGLKDRASSLRPQGGGTDLALLAAVFGVERRAARLPRREKALPQGGRLGRRQFERQFLRQLVRQLLRGRRRRLRRLREADRWAAAPRDRFGLTWHPLLAGAILTNGHRLDIVEVIPEGGFLDSRRARRALRTLAREIPVAIHGVSLGLASAEGIDLARLDAFARLMDDVVPEHWSDHLAFVRAGGVELGHLAAPTRSALTVEATAENLDRAARRVGAPPLAENVATLLDPPGSDRSEQAWLLELLDASGSDLLLDLHNLVTNGRNLGYDPLDAGGRAARPSHPRHPHRRRHRGGGHERRAAAPGRSPACRARLGLRPPRARRRARARTPST